MTSDIDYIKAERRYSQLIDLRDKGLATPAQDAERRRLGDYLVERDEHDSPRPMFRQFS